MSTYATIQLVGSGDINFDAAAAASILLRSIHRRRRRRSNDSFVWNLQRIDNNIKCAAASGENKSEKIEQGNSSSSSRRLKINLKITYFNIKQRVSTTFLLLGQVIYWQKIIDKIDKNLLTKLTSEQLNLLTMP